MKEVAEAAGLPEDKAEKAVGIYFHLILSQGHAAKSAELLDKLPGPRNWRPAMAAASPAFWRAA
ncbi:MAG: hypothetical protein U1E15_07360 [Hyphomicrobiales bacterium]